MGETTELYPGHAQELARHAERVKRLEAASANPLPGPLLEAYAHIPVEVAGFRIRPIVHYDFVLLAQIGSPLLEHLKGANGSKTEYTDEQSYQMIWQFTRPARQVAAELDFYRRQEAEKNPAADPAATARAVRDRFAARSREEIGMALGPVECGLLIKAVEREFIRAFSTVVSYQAKPQEGETFTTPPAPETTASAGGSTTSAV